MYRMEPVTAASVSSGFSETTIRSFGLAVLDKLDVIGELRTKYLKMKRLGEAVIS